MSSLGYKLPPHPDSFRTEQAVVDYGNGPVVDFVVRQDDETLKAVDGGKVLSS